MVVLPDCLVTENKTPAEKKLDYKILHIFTDITNTNLAVKTV
jgi:hypothetical protein